MNRRTLARLLDEADAESSRSASAILKLIRERRGEPGYGIQKLVERRPDFAVAQGLQTLMRGRALEPRVAELVAVASAAALQCEWSIRAHVEAAKEAGANEDEIFEALLIAGSIAQSSTQAVAFREFDAAIGQAAAPAPRRRRAAVAAPAAAVPERRRRPAAASAPPPYPSREAFWGALVERFQQAVPRARLSKSTNPYWRAIRLGRGRLQLTWAFRRRGNLAIQVLMDGAAGRSGQPEGVREAVSATLGQEAVLEAERGRRAGVAIYYPVRGAGMTEEAVSWGVDTMARLYRVLSLVEGRRRRRGRRPRGPAPDSPEGRLLSALQGYLPAPRTAASRAATPPILPPR